MNKPKLERGVGHMLPLLCARRFLEMYLHIQIYERIAFLVGFKEHKYCFSLLGHYTTHLAELRLITPINSILMTRSSIKPLVLHSLLLGLGSQSVDFPSEKVWPCGVYLSAANACVSGNPCAKIT